VVAGRSGGGEQQLISGQAALIHTDGWTWEDMAVERTAAMHLLFPSIAGRGGRGGGAIPDSVLELISGTAGASFTQARRTYEQQIAKLNDFFDQAASIRRKGPRTLRVSRPT